MLSVCPELKQLAEKLSQYHLSDLFAETPTRGANYTLRAGELWLNYSRNHLSDAALAGLLDLAKQSQLSEHITALFAGETLNHSEGRAARHTLLRAPCNTRCPDSVAIHGVLDQMAALCVRLDEHNRTQADKISDIVCIGIGGSELGSKVVDACFASQFDLSVKLHFVANIDAVATDNVMRRLDPKHCWFVIASKTFTTFETKQNSDRLLAWATQSLGANVVMQHFFAVTASPDVARSQGYLPEHILTFWDFIGGRFSLCSAIGLPIALAYGMSFFNELLSGAHAMDQHFQHTPFAENMPVMLALIHTWYSNFMGYPTRAVIPYSEQLERLPSYLQQLEMESLGKSTNLAGQPLDYATSPIVWGSAGSNGQHAFFQLLHQGTQIVPVDFIAYLQPNAGSDVYHHNALLANALAQSQSLMQGGTFDSGKNGVGVFAGNRPSNFILLDALTPRSLGSLLVLYEHKVFVQSVLWNINAFDQWGVELGKKIASHILQGIDHDVAMTHAQVAKMFEH